MKLKVADNRPTYRELLNHPCVLKSIDDNNILLPESLQNLITVAQTPCVGLDLIFIFFIT
jgi:hypothetical protein